MMEIQSKQAERQYDDYPVDITVHNNSVVSSPRESPNSDSTVVSIENSSDAAMLARIENLTPDNLSDEETILCFYCINANREIVDESYFIPVKDLIQHVLDVHSFQFICDCKEKFSTRSLIKEHMRMEHCKETDYQLHPREVALQKVDLIKRHYNPRVCGQDNYRTCYNCMLPNWTVLSYNEHVDTRHYNLALVCPWTSTCFKLDQHEEFKNHVMKTLEEKELDEIIDQLEEYEFPRDYSDFIKRHCYKCGDLLNLPTDTENHCNSQYCREVRMFGMARG